ncbi:hypothetical protein CPB86DRAFT_794868 [Serendipita vermifera]|nr:hypothetical protein CPB86DRAFT_794868 [Serendipita vermifera]
MFISKIVISGLKVTSLVSGEKTRLTKARWHLWDEITRALQDNKGNKKLEAVISSYNEIMGGLHNLEVGPRVDPMDKLPSEIVTYILSIVSYKDSWYTSRFVDSLIDLTFVSKKWRSFILSEPLLWNSIYLGNNSDLCAITSMQLALSKDLPLTLQIVLPFEQWNSIRSDIIRHRDRIETIVFSGFYSYDQGLERDKDIRKILEDLGPLPVLRQLGGAYQSFSETYDVPWIINYCHSLKEIINIPIATQDLRVVKERLAFRELTTFECPEHILSVAETLQELRKVVFLRGHWLLARNDMEKTNLQQVALSTHSLGWTHLTYTPNDLKFFKSLLHRLPNLVMLEIKGNFHTLQHVVSIAGQFPKLGHFKAMIFFDTEEKFIFPDNIAPNLSVHTLELSIGRGEYYEYRVENNPNFHLQCQSVHMVPEMMLHAMPNAQYLHLYMHGMFSEVPFFSLEDCFAGKEIYFHFSECGTIPIPDSRIPESVEKLSVGCGRAVSCSLSSRTLRSLTIHQMASYYMRPTKKEPSSDLLMLDLGAWPSLESISFDENWIMWSKTSHTSLKKVSIQRLYNDSNRVTSFIKDIACSPESYPSLEELDFEECPEWDIFIIMLERRNLLASRGVARINKLTIPESCPLWIHQIIKRPANRELSMAGNAEIILDLSLPGCYLCHKALCHCEAPPKENWQPEPDYDDKAFLARLREYPDSEDEILNTWGERSMLWESWGKEKGGRRMGCGR